jgi:uncharacterized protein (TIGR02452 family)
MDTIDCALKLKENGLKPLVLNMANDEYPGGGVDNGCSTQEESIFRRSNYHKTLCLSLYPISGAKVIYSPNVAIFKESEKNNWKILKPHVYLDFVACAGIKYPKLENGKFNENDYELLLKKIHTIFQTAIDNGHNSVVLGALGAGAFNGPAEDIAKAFEKVSRLYYRKLKNITFAIMKGYSDSNYDVFRSIFENQKFFNVTQLDSLPRKF